MIKTRS